MSIKEKGKNTMAEQIMTIEECAKYLKTSISTIYRLAQEGKIPASKIGNQWRLQKSRINEWLEKGGEKSESIPKNYT